MRRASTLLSHVITGGGPLITHEVVNQIPLPDNFNAFRSNHRLVDAVNALASPTTADFARLDHYGKIVGSNDWQDLAKCANDFTPVFTPFDRQGRRIDNVTFHESYHRLMAVAIENGIPSSPHTRQQSPPTPWSKSSESVVRGAMSLMHYQLENGTGCPLTMTYAAVPVLRAHNKNGAFDEWIAKLTAGKYDPSDQHVSLKKGTTCGMSMTEKQGGSDVRRNTTLATPQDGGKHYTIVGHKWFTSAPMCDAFLTLAQVVPAPGAAPQLSCFLVPRWVAPGERNVGLRFQRLKNKLGDKSNASSEVEYHGAVGYLVGPLGQGVRTIIDMVNHTRLDCMLGSAGLMQAALMWAVNSTTHREAFGAAPVATKPLMLNVLSDLTLESEAATALALRVAASFDRPEEDAFRRIAVAIGKYFICKRAPGFTYEALECMGGNGYVEDFPLARWYRQAPLNAVWEGSGNVIVLDVFRAMAKEADAIPALKKEVESVGDERVTSAFEQAIALSTMPHAELSGRHIVERLALVLEACALHKTGGPPSIFQSFVASRLESSHKGYLFGAMHRQSVLDLEVILRNKVRRE
jgi:putative acyl-CoA dehydrogenase